MNIGSDGIVKSSNIYLASLLIGILTFSVLFQEIHIRLHHLHNHEHHCGIYHKSEDVKSHKNETPLLTESEHHCLICDYQISPNKWFKLTPCEYRYSEKSELHFEIMFSEFQICILPGRSSRAPPALSV